MTLSLPTRYIFSLTLAPSCPIHPFRPPPPLGRSPRDPPSIQIHQPRSAPIHPSHPASDHRPQFQRHPTNHRTSAMPCFLSPPCLARCPICIAPLPAFPAAASLPELLAPPAPPVASPEQAPLKRQATSCREPPLFLLVPAATAKPEHPITRRGAATPAGAPPCPRLLPPRRLPRQSSITPRIPLLPIPSALHSPL